MPPNIANSTGAVGDTYWQRTSCRVWGATSGTGCSIHAAHGPGMCAALDRKSTRLNSSHVAISYAVFCLKKKKKNEKTTTDESSNNLTGKDTLNVCDDSAQKLE